MWFVLSLLVACILIVLFLLFCCLRVSLFVCLLFVSILLRVVWFVWGYWFVVFAFWLGGVLTCLILLIDFVFGCSLRCYVIIVLCLFYYVCYLLFGEICWLLIVMVWCIWLELWRFPMF